MNHPRRWKLVPVALVTLLSVWTLGVSAGEQPPSLSRDIQPIFDSYCVQCHMLKGAQAGLVLEEGEAYGRLVGTPSSESKLFRVEAGSPSNSYLIRKLQGTHLQVGGSGMGMPLVEGLYRPLDKQQIELIRRWIELGAKDN
jgi:mono/diheme cytochrome c family protein